MDHLRTLKVLCIGLSCLGLILPAPSLEAAQPKSAASRASTQQPAKLVGDVELDASGNLHGLVVDVQGKPMSNAVVVLHSPDSEPIKARADASGRFRFARLKGGMYRLAVNGRGTVIRAWTARTAPPAARDAALIVVDGNVVRGQMPLEEFFASDAVIIVGLVAAVIAIPIAIHNSRPSSP